MAKSKIRIKVRMVSTAGTGHYYTTTKNPRTVTTKLSLRKYDPVVRKTVVYEEKKIK